MNWKRLLAELSERGWKQQQIALRVGAAQASISDLSRGKTASPTYELGRAIELLHASKEAPPVEVDESVAVLRA